MKSMSNNSFSGEQHWPDMRVLKRATTLGVRYQTSRFARLFVSHAPQLEQRLLGQGGSLAKTGGHPGRTGWTPPRGQHLSQMQTAIMRAAATIKRLCPQRTLRVRYFPANSGLYVRPSLARKRVRDPESGGCAAAQPLSSRYSVWNPGSAKTWRIAAS